MGGARQILGDSGAGRLPDAAGGREEEEEEEGA